MDTLSCVYILTNVEWDPYSTKFAEDESKMHEIADDELTPNGMYIKSISSNHDDFPDKIVNNLSCTISSTMFKKQLFIKSEDIVTKCAISLKMAQDIIKATTQAFVRNIIHPIECCFRTKVAMLCYNHLKCSFYSDTLFPNQ
jgi:hypothetical protein